MTDEQGRDLRASITARRIGREARPLVAIDDFARDPAALRAAAVAARFGAAAHHYPGIRAPLPGDYLRAQLPLIAPVLAQEFGMSGRIEVIDASFSIVTRRPSALTLQQRLPHCDAFARNRIALVHYLSPAAGAGTGTGFFRHRSTGFEAIDAARKPIYFGQLEAELRHGARPQPGYVLGDTPLFEETARIDAKYNRAILYRSWLLHSGAIAPDADLSPDPASGRLTITGFLSVE